VNKTFEHFAQPVFVCIACAAESTPELTQLNVQLRVFHFLFAVSWVGGAAIALGKRRGVECPPAPPCGNVGQVPYFCDNEAFLAYSKPDHVSHLFVLGYDWHLRLVIVVSVGFAFVIGPGEERVRMIAMFLNHLQSFAGLQQACLRFEIRFFV
jgi:hypothetical protein